MKYLHLVQVKGDKLPGLLLIQVGALIEICQGGLLGDLGGTTPVLVDPASHVLQNPPLHRRERHVSKTGLLVVGGGKDVQ